MAKVLFVDGVDLATTRSKPPRLMVSVQGRVTSTGWSSARLEPWVYLAPPEDGLQDLDLVATPPSGPAGQALMPVAANASFWLPDWCKGVRVHASANSLEALVAGREPIELLTPDVAAAVGGPDAWPWLIAPERAETLKRIASLGAETTADAKVSDLIDRPARVIREGDYIDMMYLPERVTIVLARDKSVIVDVRFG